MARTAVLGFPRIGAERELKFALEDHWAGRASRAPRWSRPRARCAPRTCAGGAGIDVLPVGDFALYDHVLDAAEMAGIVADRHPATTSSPAAAAAGVTPLEMTKWFDTNYHYLVPELRDGSVVRAATPASGSSTCARRASWASARGRSCSARSRC